MNNKKHTLPTMLLMFGISFNANAALIGVNDHGNYFTDTTSGIDWMDITLTINRTYNDVTSELGAGGEFEGWRFATGAEFGAMLTNTTGIDSGITGVDQFISGVAKGPYGLLIDLFGDVAPTNISCIPGGFPGICPTGINHRRSTGFLAESQGGSWQWGASINERNEDFGDLDGANTSGSPRIDISYEHSGSFLVRGGVTPGTPVSSPSALLLMLAGLAGFTLSKRKSSLALS